jgi:hypothetical protein
MRYNASDLYVRTFQPSRTPAATGLLPCPLLPCRRQGHRRSIGGVLRRPNRRGQASQGRASPGEIKCGWRPIRRWIATHFVLR